MILRKTSTLAGILLLFVLSLTCNHNDSHFIPDNPADTNKVDTNKIYMATYYVATTGDDGGAGTIGDPWATWQKGFSELSAGDLLYIRGGTYTPSGTTGTGDGGSTSCGVYIVGVDGSAGNLYSVANYPGETPVLDGGSLSASNRSGVLLNDCSYWHIKGLTVTGVDQSSTSRSMGFQLSSGSNNLFENCVSHHNGGPGFQTRVPNGNGIIFLNCDAYYNYDPNTGGDDADGFDIGFGSSGYEITLVGCRAWDNSDDGYDIYQYSGHYSVYFLINCWAWNNGWIPGTSTQAGDGNGFKLGLDGQVYNGVTQRYLYNCLAVNNRQRGFSQESARVKKEFYNCVAYGNGSHGFSFGWTGDSSGFEVADVCRNNVSYGNDGDPVENLHGGTFYATRISDHNSWDVGTGVTVSAADFINLTASELEGARQSGGALPLMDFLHLDTGSDLITAGSSTDIYATDGDGNAWATPDPSIGAYEYDGVPPGPTLATVTTDDVTDIASTSATMGGNVTSDGGDTILECGITFDTLSPTVWGDSTTVDFTPQTGPFSDQLGPLIPDRTYYVRAYVINSVGLAYGNEVTFDSLAEPTTLVTDITVTSEGGVDLIDVNDGTLQMYAGILPVDATDPTVTWSTVALTGSASIDVSGLLTALTDGFVGVVATANDASGVTGSLVVLLSNQSTFDNAKIRDQYRDYSPDDMASRATVPIAANINTTAATIECIHINTFKVADALGEEGADYTIRSLCENVSVNPWSAFGPTIRTVNSATPKMLVNSAPTSHFKLGDFAGYNHAATAPAYVTDPLGPTQSITAGDTVHYEITIGIGEAVYIGSDIVGREDDCTGVAMSLWTDDGSLLFQTKGAVECPMAEVIDIESVASQVSFGSMAGGYRLAGTDMHKIGGAPWYGTIEVRIELVDVAPDGVASVPEIASNYDFSGTHIICQIPGLEHYHQILRLQVPTYIYHSASGLYTLTVVNEQFVTGSGGSAGHLSWEGATIDHSYATSLQVTARVQDWEGNILTDVYEIRAATPYVANAEIRGFLNEHIWKSGGLDMDLPVPGYDLVCYVFFNGID